jgi:predicted RND superfamily exporter protein
MALLSALFWVIEGKPAYIALNTKPQFHCGLKSFLNVTVIILWLFNVISQSKFLIIDVFCTVSITWLFGLGGVIGTAMGLSISNVISIALLIAKLKENKLPD